MKEYFEMLEKNKDFFERAFEIAKDIKKRATEIFGECRVYIVGSFARGKHRLSSDLDILIVSDRIPERLDFEWYSEVVKKLTDDPRVEIHLANEENFKKLERVYSPRIEVP